VTCGTGSHNRSRKVEQIAMNGGRSCKEGDNIELDSCGTQLCTGNPAYHYINSSQPKIVLPNMHSGGSGKASHLIMWLSMILRLMAIDLLSNYLPG